jgi:hypothetical protein
MTNRFPRRTSIQAFHAIQTSGVLSKRRQQAYETLFHYGPMTGAELCQKANTPGLWKRLSELQEMNLAVPIGERRCAVTGQTVTLWDVTEHMPSTPMPKRKKIRDACRACSGRGYFEREQFQLIMNGEI